MKDPPHPGEVVKREVVDALGLSVSRAAVALGVGRAALSAVLRGASPITPSLALRIEKAFGPRMEHLMRMQYAYDIARMRRRAATVRVARYRPAAA